MLDGSVRRLVGGAGRSELASICIGPNSPSRPFSLQCMDCRMVLTANPLLDKNDQLYYGESQYSGMTMSHQTPSNAMSVLLDDISLIMSPITLEPVRSRFVEFDWFNKFNNAWLSALDVADLAFPSTPITVLCKPARVKSEHVDLPAHLLGKRMLGRQRAKCFFLLHQTPDPWRREASSPDPRRRLLRQPDGHPPAEILRHQVRCLPTAPCESSRVRARVLVSARKRARVFCNHKTFQVKSKGGWVSARSDGNGGWPVRVKGKRTIGGEW